MKKILCGILIAIILCFSMVSASAVNFTDVKDYSEAINYLADLKIVQGTTETTFSPDENVTRWQMALFMARATSGIVDDANWSNGANIFADCTQYLGAIQYCYGKGIIKGTTPTTFSPNASITLKDGVIMAIRALGYEKEDEGLEASAKKYNVSGASYWLPYYQKAIELDMLTGLSGLSVNKALTRGETAQLIYNTFKTKAYNGYTLEEIVFKGIDNTITNAWVIETPKQYFTSLGKTIDEDEDIIKVGFYNENEEFETLEIPFEEKDVEDYFCATLEIINLDNGEYEFIRNIKTNNFSVDNYSAITYINEKLKINGKTYKVEDITFVEPTEDGYTEIKLADFVDKYYDVYFVNIDEDAAYEYAIVEKYNIAEYSPANIRYNEETCGVMKGEKEVVYSDTLTEGETFVYTYNPIFKYVNVKNYANETTGTVNGYKETEEDDEIIITVTIGKKDYTISDTDIKTVFNDTDGVEMASSDEIKEFVMDNINNKIKFFALDNILYAFGEVVEEAVPVKYLTATNDFVDYVKGSYITMTANFDGIEKIIKVKKIYNADKELVLDIVKDNRTKVMSFFDNDAFGLYSYKEENGYYTLTATAFPYEIKDYITDKDILIFEDYETKNPVDRQKTIRINDKTDIYVIDFEEKAVTKVATTENFFITIDEDTLFYADKIGYGADDTNGVASVIYIATSGTIYTLDEYDIVYVYEETSGREVKDFDFDDEEVFYSKFAVKAYSVTTMDKIKYLYDANTVEKLEIGVYLIDKNGVIVDKKITPDAGKNTMELDFAFYYETIKTENIDIYFKSKTITTDTLKISETCGIKNIEFMDLDGKVYSEEKLVKYIGDEAITVIIVPNYYSGHIDGIEYKDNTVKGIIIG